MYKFYERFEDQLRTNTERGQKEADEFNKFQKEQSVSAFKCFLEVKYPDIECIETILGQGEVVMPIVVPAGIHCRYLTRDEEKKEVVWKHHWSAEETKLRLYEKYFIHRAPTIEESVFHIVEQFHHETVGELLNREFFTKAQIFIRRNINMTWYSGYCTGPIVGQANMSIRKVCETGFFGESILSAIFFH